MAVRGRLHQRNYLCVDGLDGLGFEELPLSVNKRWYRTVSETGALVLMYGRDLPGMSWEDPTYLQRAAEAGRLVAALVSLSIRPQCAVRLRLRA